MVDDRVALSLLSGRARPRNRSGDTCDPRGLAREEAGLLIVPERPRIRGSAILGHPFIQLDDVIKTLIIH